MPHDELFKKGDSVEVSPDDAGLSGSWYEATIITVYPTPKSKKKNPALQYYDLQYKTLLDDEDETKLLTERVRANRIRPLPSTLPREHRFELNDAVEVFHRDGWWVGVITEILRDSGGFQVTFSDPPDQIVCVASDLRVHLQWNDGAWVQPQAHVAANQLEIEENRLKKERSHQELAVDGASKNRSRRVIKTPLSGKRKAMEPHDQIKTRSSMKRRPRLIVSSSDDDPTNGEKEEGSKEVCGNRTDEDGIRETGVCTGNIDPIKNKSDTHSQPQAKKTHSAPCVDDSGRSPNLNVKGVNDSLNESELVDKETLDRAVSVAIAGAWNGSAGNGSTFANSNKEPKIVEKAVVIDFYGYKFMHQSGESGIVKQAASEEPNGSNVINPGQELEGMEQGAIVKENKLLNPSQETDNLEETADQATAFEGHNNINPIQEMGIMEQPAAVDANENDFVNPSQETEIVEQAAATEENTREVINPNQELEIIEGHTSAIVEGNVADRNVLKLPFGKTLALWNVIESMPIFESIRQRPPHFRSLLDKYPVHCREGKAIGYMLIFRDVLQKTVKSKLDEERESISEILGTLPKLEKNGFEVKRIRNHLTKLLKSKNKYDHIKNRLMEQIQKKEKVVDVIEELEKQIKERQEKCVEAISTKEKIEYEIAHFDSNLLALRQRFDENVFEFERETAASM